MCRGNWPRDNSVCRRMVHIVSEAPTSATDGAMHGPPLAREASLFLDGPSRALAIGGHSKSPSRISPRRPVAFGISILLTLGHGVLAALLLQTSGGHVGAAAYMTGWAALGAVAVSLFAALLAALGDVEAWGVLAIPAAAALFLLYTLVL